MSRAFLFIMDSVGIGGAPDAAAYGDEGSNTLGHIAAACHAGDADRDGLRSGRLKLPNLERIGLGLAALSASGELPAGFDPDIEVAALFASACEQSRGKDTPSGHWEIAGVPVDFEWGYFPKTEPCFPQSLTDAAIQQADLPGILGNKHASGTEIIAELGEAHVETGKPIFYTSADSVIQIAAHEEAFGLERLYRLCEIVRPLADPLNIGRIIARPFTGESAENFVRTGNRRDYSVPPPGKTLLDRVTENGGQVFAVGKIDDIFAHRGTTHVMKANGNDALFDTTLEAMARAGDGDLVVTNFIDFDQLYGHRRDVAGYAACLEHFDTRLPELTGQLGKDDMMVLTADHGNDPTWSGTDHTREQVPALFSGPRIAPGNGGTRDSFADIGATIADHLGLSWGPHGTSLLGGRG